MINKIKTDMTEEVIRSALKRNVKQFNHMLKCNRCMKHYVKIISCMISEQRIKERRKLKEGKK